jgi:phytoene/squalene synthetase
MHGRYASSQPPEFIARLFQTVNALPSVAPSWNIAPSQDAMAADRSRLYLPREYLDGAHVPHDPLATLGTPRLPEVCARVAALAQFDAAREAMADCGRQAMRPAHLVGATHAAISLARLERRGWARLDQRVRLPTLQKLWVALRYGLVT